jgi:hypothetical protein
VGTEQIAAIDASRPGDPVMICLVRNPHRCQPGDWRGKLNTDLRSAQCRMLPDAEQMCRGA